LRTKACKRAELLTRDDDGADNSGNMEDKLVTLDEENAVLVRKARGKGVGGVVAGV
jgi:hypothetical protein